MVTARDIMTEGAECVGPDDTLTDTARRMRDLDVGALPICGEDGRLAGMVTDRDIVVGCVADGGDPSTATVGSLGLSEVVTIGADDDAEEIRRTMAEHQVRRLPVVDGHDLVGMVSQADVARALDPVAVAGAVQGISE